MRPLTDEEMEEFGIVTKASPVEQDREKEIREFWSSGAAAAELPKYSTLTIETEKEYYKRAIRRVGRKIGLDWYRDVEVRVRKGKIIIVRKKTEDAEQIHHVESTPEIMGYEK